LNEGYLAVVFLHVLAAAVWIGGMLFFAVAAPVLRRIDDDAVRAGLFDAIGRRFRSVGWLCVGVLLTTGLVQLRSRGWWGSGFWNPSSLLGTPVGIAMVWKLALVAVLLGVQAIHDFWLGPRAGRAATGTDEARALRRGAAGLARLNAVLAVLLVYVAVRLGRGG
jgi:putative copper export protein